MPQGLVSRSDFRTLRRIATFFSHYKTSLSIVFALVVFATLLDLVNPLLTRVLFDDAIGKHNLRLLLIVVSAMLVTPIARVVVSIFQTYLNASLGQRVMRDLRNRLYDHLQHMSFRFFTSTMTGEIQSRLSNDIGGIETVLTDSFSNTVRNVSSAMSLIIAMLILSPLLTLVSLGLLPVVYVVSSRVGRLNRVINKERQESLATLTTLIQETLSVSGALLIKTFGRQDMMQMRFERENQKLADLSIRRQMVGIWLFMSSMLIFSVAPVFVYLLAGWQIIESSHPTVTTGTIIAFTSLQARLVSGLSPITQLLNTKLQLQGSFALFDRIFDYLDMPAEIADMPNAIRMDPSQVRGAITFRNVSFTYRRDQDLGKLESLIHDAKTNNANRLQDEVKGIEGANNPEINRGTAIHNISFDVEPGQLVALVGPSGAGKTTLISIVPRLYDVDFGSVLIDGQDVKTIALASISEIVGMVMQETYLFHASVRENLLFARPSATDEDIIAATTAAAIHDRILELENGYDTLVGERGYKLSGGEKQRIAIARAILKDPRILILDEATSALDSHSERLIQGSLDRVMKGRTTIAIAHRLSTILTADLILVLDKGKITERGTHNELLECDGLYAKLYREQFSRAPDENS